MLTGESTPVAKATGGKVIGGSINGEGSLTIEVKGTGKDSFLSQVIDFVKQAQESKSKTQDLANTAAMWLTMVALGSMTRGQAHSSWNILEVVLAPRLHDGRSPRQHGGILRIPIITCDAELGPALQQTRSTRPIRHSSCHICG